MLIRRCTALPSNFPLDDDMVFTPGVSNLKDEMEVNNMIIAVLYCNPLQVGRRYFNLNVSRAWENIDAHSKQMFEWERVNFSASPTLPNFT